MKRKTTPADSYNNDAHVISLGGGATRLLLQTLQNSWEKEFLYSEIFMSRD